MKLKKLILSVLGLFILAVASHAAKNPADPSFKPVLKAGNYASECHLKNTTLGKYYPSLTDPDYKFTVPEKYIKVGNDTFEILDEAINKNDRVAAEVVKYCLRSGTSAVNTTEGINISTVLSFYGGKNAVDIIKYIMSRKTWHDEAFIISPLKESSRTPIAISSEYGRKDVVKLLLEAPDEYRANPYAKVMDYLEDSRGKMKDSFDLAANDEILKILRTIKPTAALIEDAVRKSLNYAMTNEKWILKAMRETADNSISRDVFRLFDINGYKTDITRI
jgi:hypothetical protein